MIRILKIIFGCICTCWGVYVAYKTTDLIGTVSIPHLIFSWLFGVFCIWFGVFVFAEGINHNKLNNNE